MLIARIDDHLASHHTGIPNRFRTGPLLRLNHTNDNRDENTCIDIEIPANPTSPTVRPMINPTLLFSSVAPVVVTVVEVTERVPIVVADAS